MTLNPPDVLSGPRLDLHLVTVEQVLSRDGEHDPVAIAFADPDDILSPENSPLAHRIPQVRADPSVNPWLIRLAVDRPDEDGVVEIGYRVTDRFRRNGYGREIAQIMWDFAASHPDVKILRATVSPTNAPSMAIITSAGFTHVGEQDDPEDGLEYVFDMSVADYRAKRESAI